MIFGQYGVLHDCDSGSAVAVTGAASGIGRALALELAARGADLALADRDEAGLRRWPPSSPSKRAQGDDAPRRCQRSRADRGFANAAIAAHPSLNIVINNAGVALLGQFNEIDQAQIEWLMNINFWGVVHGTRAFLPHLSSQAGGAYRQPLLDLRHHRPARPDRLLRGEIRGARLFREPAA